MPEFPPRPDSFYSPVSEFAAPVPPPDEGVTVSTSAAELQETPEAGVTEATPVDEYDFEVGPAAAEELSEQQIIDLELRLAEGDPEALVTLLGHYGPRIHRMIAKRLYGAGRDFVDDVYQEWQLSVFTSFDKFERKHDSSFIAWITTIAHHRIADEIRKIAKNRKRVVSVPDFNAHAEAQTQSAGLERRGEAVLETYPSDTDNQELYALLAELTPKQRDIIVLRLGFGFSAEEAAGMANSTPGAVRVAQYRALDRLRRIVKKNPQEYVELHDRLFGSQKD